MEWKEDIKAYARVSELDFPLVADPSRRVAMLLGMLGEGEASMADTGLPVTVRATMIVNPHKRLAAMLVYPLQCVARGRLGKQPVSRARPAESGAARRS